VLVFLAKKAIKLPMPVDNPAKRVSKKAIIVLFILVPPQYNAIINFS